MISKKDLEAHAKHVKDKMGFIKNHKVCGEIVFEQGLSNWLDEVIAEEYPKSDKQVQQRKTPTNYFESYVNKVSKTHSIPPDYSIKEDDTASTNLNNKLEACDWHNNMIWAQRVLNTHQSVYVEPFTSESILGPSVRIWRGHEFEAYSREGSPEPSVPDTIIKFLGSGEDSSGKYFLRESVDKDEIVKYRVREDLEVQEIYRRANPMKELPGEYLQSKPFGLKGDPDVELLFLTKVANTNVADLNYTFKFTHHPIRIAKNLDLAEGDSLDLNPDSIVETKTRLGDIGKESGIETIYTKVDYKGGFEFNQNNVIAFFIARGAVLKMEQPSERPMSADVADMSIFDLTAIWEQQKSLFTGFEKSLLRKFVKYNNLFKDNFSDKSELPADKKLHICYCDSDKIESKSVRLANSKMEKDLGITTRKRIIQVVNPRMTPDEVIDLEAELEEQEIEEVSSDSDEDSGKIDGDE